VEAEEAVQVNRGAEGRPWWGHGDRRPKALVEPIAKRRNEAEPVGPSAESHDDGAPIGDVARRSGRRRHGRDSERLAGAAQHVAPGQQSRHGADCRPLIALVLRVGIGIGKITRSMIE
jgi:hypothetical protein